MLNAALSDSATSCTS